MKRHVFGAAFGALLIVLPIRQALRADAALYTVEDLGTVDGAAPTVTGINASGQVSGYVVGASGMPRAVRYTNGVGWEDVPGVGTFFSAATGINDAGDVVGYEFSLTTMGFRAFRYASGAGLAYIDPLPGFSSAYGFGINPSGEIVGRMESPSQTRGFRAAPGLPAVLLPMLPGGTVSGACGVNATGQVAGFSTNGSGNQHAYRVEVDNSVTDIVPFDGVAGSGSACAIDAAGRVGGRTTDGGSFRAFTFDSGAAANVDTFAASEQSNVEAISAGVAVGWFVSPTDGAAHAFVNTADGSFELNSLVAAGTGWTLDQAFAVNASGAIAGNGTLNGAPRAFRLTRVAEDHDTTAPTITALSATPSSIAPPSNAMVAVQVSASATDDRDPSPVCSLTGIDGHGAPSTDFSVTGPLSGSVRAKGGATYSFAVSCSDAAGNAAAGSVDVTVPPDTTAPVIASLSVTPSTIWPPNGALVPVSLAVSATDDVDSAPSCALASISATSITADDYVITGSLSATLRAVGARTYTLTVSCADLAGNRASAAVPVVVPPDTTAPVIAGVSATPDVIWPPNGKMVPVSVAVNATDDVDAEPSCALVSIVANSGGPDDAAVTGTLSGEVRAVKNANGSPRVYTLTVACRDAAGNQAWGSASVVVDKDGVALKGADKAKLKQAVRRVLGYFSRGSSR